MAKLEKFVERKRDTFIAISNYVWDHPEIRYEEAQSSLHLMEALSQEGFTLTKNIANIPTAFMAQWGEGKPVIAFLGEYDALPNLSQAAQSTTHTPLETGGHGHGCGHNLLGTGALAAAVSLKDYLQQTGTKGTVRFYGCPAEEGGSGKTYMTRAGAFDDVDTALTWHPGPVNATWSLGTLANVQAAFKFTGRSAHAATSPHLGRSALDAVELMNVGTNYLREHIIPQARVHYAVTNTGGISPNVVQADAEVLYLIRTPQTEQLMAIYERIQNIAKGAAMMTGTEVEVVFDKACSNYVPLDSLSKLIADTMQDVGAATYTDEEQAFAKALQQTYTKEEMAAASMGVPALAAALTKPISDVVIPYFTSSIPLFGSTDVGDVSWKTPTGQCVMATCAVGTTFHTWQFVTQGKTSYAHKGMLQVAKVLAEVGRKLIEEPAHLPQIKAEHTQKVGDGYVCPIPADVKPPVLS